MSWFTPLLSGFASGYTGGLLGTAGALGTWGKVGTFLGAMSGKGGGGMQFTSPSVPSASIPSTPAQGQPFSFNFPTPSRRRQSTSGYGGTQGSGFDLSAYL